MKSVQCYELFGGIALKNHAFSFSYTVIQCSCEILRIVIHTAFCKVPGVCRMSKFIVCFFGIS